MSSERDRIIARLEAEMGAACAAAFRHRAEFRSALCLLRTWYEKHSWEYDDCVVRFVADTRDLLARYEGENNG